MCQLSKAGARTISLFVGVLLRMSMLLLICAVGRVHNCPLHLFYSGEDVLYLSLSLFTVANDGIAHAWNDSMCASCFFFSFFHQSTLSQSTTV